MLTVQRYDSSRRDAWNEFIAGAKNATFLFHRDYMEYHAERFEDHSIMLYDGELVAVFPANQKSELIISHEGLSYGGLILGTKVKLDEALRYFYHALCYYHQHSFRQLVYKCFPSYLARYPAQEDLYALYLLDARLTRRDTSCVYDRTRKLPYQSNKKYSISKARKAGYTVRSNEDATEFWDRVLTPTLKERFGVRPVHTSAEMNLLISRFPAAITLHEVTGNNTLDGGAVVYEMADAVHIQYLAATPSGKDNGALDYLVHQLIDEVYASKRIVSFGISNVDQGRTLNRGLNSWKESFGARNFALDCYEVELARHTALSEYA